MTPNSENDEKAEIAITEPELRKKHIQALKAWCKGQTSFPEICRDMKCEARTRSGRPCKNDGTLWGNGRCKFHGGCSTGPTSEEGKRKSALNGYSKAHGED